MWSFLIVSVLVASAQAKFYTDCGSTLGTVESVGVSGCDENAKECVLKRNTNATISIDFIPSKDVSKMTAEVHGVIMNLPVPFPLPESDACKNSGFTCPVKAGTKVSYRATLPVLKSYPKVKVEVKWELQNEDEKDLVCVMIPAKIH